MKHLPFLLSKRYVIVGYSNIITTTWDTNKATIIHSSYHSLQFTFKGLKEYLKNEVSVSNLKGSNMALFAHQIL